MKHAREIPAGEFKAKCLKLMDEVQETREEVVITKRGNPVAKLVPVPLPETSSLVESLGKLKGTFEVVGDIVGPTGLGLEEEVLENWDSLMADVKKSDQGPRE